MGVALIWIATFALLAGVQVEASCTLCYTCGGDFETRVATLQTGWWLEFGDDCSESYREIRDDYSYVCCDNFLSATSSNGTVTKATTLLTLNVTGASKEQDAVKEDQVALDLIQKGSLEQVPQPSNCLLCYTCGGYYPNQVATLTGGPWLEYGSDCGGVLAWTSSDQPYVCCYDQRGVQSNSICPSYVFKGYCDDDDIDGGAACVHDDVWSGRVPLTNSSQIQCVPKRDGGRQYTCPGNMIMCNYDKPAERLRTMAI